MFRMFEVCLKDNLTALPDLSTHSATISCWASARVALSEIDLKLLIALSPRSPTGLISTGKMSTNSSTPHFSLIALMVLARAFFEVSLLWPAYKGVSRWTWYISLRVVKQITSSVWSRLTTRLPPALLVAGEALSAMMGRFVSYKIRLA
jgi:hypothetical protein